MRNGYTLWFVAIVLASAFTVVLTYHDALIALAFWALATLLLMLLRPD